MVYAKTEEQCYKNLIDSLNRLEEHHLCLNKEKFEFLKAKVQYLRYIIPQGRISKDLTKVSAISKALSPTCQYDVKIFSGMVIYCSNFIPNTSTLTYLLRSTAKIQLALLVLGMKGGILKAEKRNRKR